MKWLLRALWKGWKSFAHALGVVNRILFLSVFYWLCVFVVNLVLRISRTDLLDRTWRRRNSYWRSKSPNSGLHKHQF